jgi:hypothetical protein
MSPPIKAGGPDGVAIRTAAVDAPKHNGYRRVDGYVAPDAADRAEQDALALLTGAGYRLACQCLTCGRWLAHPVSVAAMRGPTCRARAGVVA